MALRITNNSTAALTQKALTSASGAEGATKAGGTTKLQTSANDSAALGINAQQAQSLSAGATLRGAQAGMNMVRTAATALDSTRKALSDMHGLMTRARTANLDESGRADLQKKLNEFMAQVDKTASETAFNDKKLLDGSMARSGVDVEAGGQTFSIRFAAAGTEALGLGGLSVADDESMAEADEAINRAYRSVRSAGISLDGTASALSIASLKDLFSVNTSAASSLVTDTREQVLQQADTAVLAQANAAPQAVLGLLR